VAALEELKYPHQRNLPRLAVCDADVDRIVILGILIIPGERVRRTIQLKSMSFPAAMRAIRLMSLAGTSSFLMSTTVMAAPPAFGLTPLTTADRCEPCSASDSVVAWSAASENSDQILKNGQVIRILVVDGIAVSASLVRTDDLMWVNVSVTNRSTSRVDIDPSHFTLEELAPKERILDYKAAEDLARSITRRAEWGAALTLLSGSLAKSETTTEVTSVGSATTSGTSNTNAMVRSYLGYGAQVSATTYGSVTTNAQAQTTIRTSGPDQVARENAALEASGITATAGMKAEKILEQALLANTVRSGDGVAGAVFFERDKKARRMRLLVPVGNYVFEIPLDLN
jgi:hypothetical protein